MDVGRKNHHRDASLRRPLGPYDSSLSRRVDLADDPDYLAFFALVDIFPEVGSLYMTDNAWTGTDFASEEGTLKVR